ncbi:MAG: universal stress protein [Solirubrobacteraceae bacterium]
MATQAGSQHHHETSAPQPVFADVLCAVDGTRGSLTAVRQSVALAGADGCVTLLAVSSPSGPGGYRGAAIDPARVDRVLEVAGQLAREAGVRCTRAAEARGSPSKMILRRASNHELLAMGAPTMSRLGGLFTGGVTESVLRSFATPLLLARPAPSEQPFGRRIVVASDARESSDLLVELGASLALQLGGGVMLVHAVGVESKARPHKIERQVRSLEAMVGDAYEVHVEADSAHSVLIEIAAHGQASLIVMGCRRPGGVRALGNVTERVIHDAPCSVLVLPPEHPSGRR